MIFNIEKIHVPTYVHESESKMSFTSDFEHVTIESPKV